MQLTRRTLIGTAAASLPLARARAQSNSPAIKIGVLNDMSGVYRDISGPGSVACARQAVEDFGNNGVPVEIVFADHQNKPDIGAGIARQWIDRDGVDLIIDVPQSAVGLAIAGVVKEKDRVYINSGAGTSDLTGTQCAPTTLHWTYDTWMLAHSTGAAMVKQGGDAWFFITADYAFGTALQRDTMTFVKEAGGKVLGSVRHPLANTDYSSFLLQAQSSGANVIGLCNAGLDTVNCVKQAAEFGIDRSKTRLAALLMFISDVHALGLLVAQKLVLTESFYWDLNAGTRAVTKRIQTKMPGFYPGMDQAGVYSGVFNYLKTVASMGVAEAKKSGAATVARMKSMPTDDDAFGPGSIREDGRVLHPAYLFEVKTPAESKGPWDYYHTLATTPANEAFRPLNQGGCSLVPS